LYAVSQVCGQREKSRNARASDIADCRDKQFRFRGPPVVSSEKTTITAGLAEIHAPTREGIRSGMVVGR